MQRADYPILEHDTSLPALIEPSKIIKPLAEMPEHCVMIFFQEAIAKVCADAPVITQLGSEIGKNPVYRLEHEGKQVAVVHAGVGAPLSGAFLDELIALGAQKFIACGGAGVLDKTIDVGNVIIPESAIRDEGTSYHYLPPSREVSVHPDGIQAIKTTLDAHAIPYVVGKTWTTDAIYRETPARIAQRRAEGALTVEMETSAFFAIAQFRGVTFAQILYGGDDVSGEKWDSRDWNGHTSVREKLLWLSVESVLRL